MNRESILHLRITLLTWFFIVGLVISGVTAIPLRIGVDWLVNVMGAELATLPQATDRPDWALWLLRVQEALRETNEQHAFLFYGTDWLAFGHFVIAIAFVGALRDPVRNRWLFDFGLIACVMVIPYALVLGAVRGITFWWRLIDCSFGVFGSVPLWFCRKWAMELEHSDCQNPACDLGPLAYHRRHGLASGSGIDQIFRGKPRGGLRQFRGASGRNLRPARAEWCGQNHHHLHDRRLAQA